MTDQEASQQELATSRLLQAPRNLEELARAIVERAVEQVVLVRVGGAVFFFGHWTTLNADFTASPFISLRRRLMPVRPMQ